MIRADSLLTRLVAGAAVWALLTLIVGEFVLSAVFRDHVQSTFDEELSTLLKNLIVATDESEEEGLMVAEAMNTFQFNDVFSGWYWQISDTDVVMHSVARSRSLFDAELDGAALARRAGDEIFLTGQPHFVELEGPAGRPLRAIVQVIEFADTGGRYFFIIARSREGMDAAISSFSTLLRWSLIILGLGLLAAVFFQVLYGLRPLDSVGRRLAAIREGRTTRLEGRFPAEIRPLAEEINKLLAHNEAVVERARTHAGNLAHALKTPLTVLANEARAPANKGPLADIVLRQADLMRTQVDHHLARARAAGRANIVGARTDVGTVCADLVRTLGRIHSRDGVNIDREIERGLVFRGDRQDLEEMIGNLLDNACKWSGGHVRVSARQRDGHEIEITVDDDGDGLDPAERERVLQRGERLDESKPGSGLGLAIIKDTAELYGGRLELSDSPLGGLRAVLRLPSTP